MPAPLLDGSLVAGRLELGRVLGAGTHGLVREAWDHRQGERVALKLLERPEPSALASLKAEYRRVFGLWHPNLVPVYELFVGPDAGGVSMELIDGVPLVETTPQPPGRAAPRGEAFRGDREAVRQRLAQAARGLTALHDAGIVHRDVKPSHLLVDRAGRLRIIDFGLGHAGGQDVGPAGSPAWTAPEVGWGQEITAAADWYSLGVVLYQLLTGQLPFAGDPVQITVARQTLQPLPPGVVVAAAPPDLTRLCMDLLHRVPAMRPDGRAVLRCLDLPAPPEPEPLAGLQRELVTLRAALDDVATGTRRVIVVEGPSGSGKTRLVRELVRQEGRRCLALAGASNPQEALPLRCLDPIMEALAAHLGWLSRHEVATLLPGSFRELTALFPTLGRLPQPAARRVPRLPGEALRELIARLAVRKPVVIVLDDAQWGDEGSAALVEQLLQRRAPLLLLACTDGLPSPVVGALERAHAERIVLRGSPHQVDPAVIASLSPAARRALDVIVAAGTPVDRVSLTRGLRPGSSVSAVCAELLGTGLARRRDTAAGAGIELRSAVRAALTTGA